MTFNEVLREHGFWCRTSCCFVEHCYLDVEGSMEILIVERARIPGSGLYRWELWRNGPTGLEFEIDLNCSKKVAEKLRDWIEL